MADTTVLSAAQIAALSDAGAVRVVTTTDSAVRAFRGTQITFYVHDVTGAPWLRVSNGSFFFDGALASVAGPTAGNSLTNAEGLALVALLRKLHVGIVHP